MEAGGATVATIPPGRMRASLAGEWRQARPAQRFASLAGGTLILVGLAHLATWLAVAVRAGLLLVAQGVGGWMIGHGVGPASDGATSGLTTFGAAGVMKVPHAVAMLAIQVLPGLAWLLSFARLPEGRRLGLVWAGSVGYGALVVVSLLQTTAGLAPLDLAWPRRRCPCWGWSCSASPSEPPCSPSATPPRPPPECKGKDRRA
jgi:hypothetical protein